MIIGQIPAVSSSPVIATSIISFLSIIAFYLFWVYRTRDDNKIKKLELLKQDDRIVQVEMELNNLGVRVDTANMSSSEKLVLLKSMLRNKTTNYLIGAIVLVVIAGIVALIIWLDGRKKPEPGPDSASIAVQQPDVVVEDKFQRYRFVSDFPTLNDSINEVIERFEDTVNHPLTKDFITIKLLSGPFTDPIDVGENSDRHWYRYNPYMMKLVVKSDTFSLDLYSERTKRVQGIQETINFLKDQNRTTVLKASNLKILKNEVEKIIRIEF